MQEHPSRGRRQQEVNHHQALLFSRYRDKRLGGESRGQREAGDSQRADNAADRGYRHGAEQATQIRAAGHTRAIDNHAGTHKQQRFINNVGEGVSGGTVDCQLRAYTDRDHHKPHLVNDGVSEYAAGVVFQQRIDNAVENHVQPYADEHRFPGE